MKAASLILETTWERVQFNMTKKSAMNLTADSISDLDGGSEATLIKSADDAKLGGVADTSEGCAAIQWDPDSLENLFCLSLFLPLSCSIF